MFTYDTKNPDGLVTLHDVTLFCENLPFRPDNTTSLKDFADLVFGDIDQNPNLDRHSVCNRPPRPLLVNITEDNINLNATNVTNPNTGRGNESFQDGVYYFNKTENVAKLLGKPVND